MSKHNDNIFKEVVTNGLRKERSTGMIQGAYAICQVILEKAKDEKKSVEARLEDVIKFCSVCTRPPKEEPYKRPTNEGDL